MTSSIHFIRQRFIGLKQLHPNGNTEDGMLELIGTSFLADQASIFGEPNEKYIQAELDWYESLSLNVNDIKPEPPQIWKNVASHEGEVNSNYGALFVGEDNGSQFEHVVKELKARPESRRAIAIYTRPTMHVDAFRDGMQDFVCTNTVHYLLRDGVVHCIVSMRSNDVVFGYRNDVQWQLHALDMVCNEVRHPPGDMIWQANSLHVYPRHFDLIPE